MCTRRKSYDKLGTRFGQVRCCEVGSRSVYVVFVSGQGRDLIRAGAESDVENRQTLKRPFRYRASTQTAFVRCFQPPSSLVDIGIPHTFSNHEG